MSPGIWGRWLPTRLPATWLAMLMFECSGPVAVAEAGVQPPASPGRARPFLRLAMPTVRLTKSHAEPGVYACERSGLGAVPLRFSVFMPASLSRIWTKLNSPAAVSGHLAPT